MEKLEKFTHEDGGIEYAFYCPGCKELHTYITKMGSKTAEYRKANGLNLVEWQFNGNTEKPSFSPSLLYHKTDNRGRCHLFLTDGVISYCSDCDHNLAGKSVPLEVIPY